MQRCLAGVTRAEKGETAERGIQRLDVLMTTTSSPAHNILRVKEIVHGSKIWKAVMMPYADGPFDLSGSTFHSRGSAPV